MNQSSALIGTWVTLLEKKRKQRLMVATTAIAMETFMISGA
jgi:hypothetical protein